MNRPLCGAVIAFALGEVVRTIAEAYKRTGMALAISVLLVLIFMLRKRRLVTRLDVVVLAIMCILGYVWMEAGDRSYSFEEAECSLIAVVDGIKRTEYGERLELSVYETDIEGSTYKNHYRMIADITENIYDVGDILELRGSLQEFDEVSNPGGFDQRRYYNTNNIAVKLKVDRITYTEELKLSWVQRLRLKVGAVLRHLKERASYALGNMCETTEAELYRGMLLGDKSHIPDEITALYKIGGISHILAISSLHITLIAGIILKLLRKTGIHVYVAYVISIIIIILYGSMVGAGVATIRAIIMFGIYIFADILGQSYDMATGMCIALIVLLLMEPKRLSDPSALMSFGAVAGILIHRYVKRCLDKDTLPTKKRGYKARLIKKLKETVLFQLCLNASMLPILAATYYEIYTYSMLVNMLVVPLMTAVVMSGVGALGVYALMPGLGGYIINIGEVILRFYERVCDVVNRLPGNRICTGHVSVIELAIYYVMLFALLALVNPKVHHKIRTVVYKSRHIEFAPGSFGRLLKLAAAGMVLMAVGGIALFRVCSFTEKIIFLDVGQGDGIIIKNKDVGIIIDGGSSSKKNIGSYVIESTAKYMGIHTVDYWIVSHADNDHVSGLKELLENEKYTGIDIKNIVMARYCGSDAATQELIEYIEACGCNIIYLEAGDVIRGESFELRCMGPDAGFKAADINSASLCVEYSSEHVRAIFTGDMDKKALDYVAEHGELSAYYDIMKVAHHGSKYSLSKDFYDEVSPRFAVISAGEDNSYGHPHSEVLSELYDRKIYTYRTDLEGAVIAECGNRGLHVYGYRNGR